MIITTSRPSPWSAATAARESSFTVSATATSPAGRSSTATNIGVLPSPDRRSASGFERGDVEARVDQEAAVADEQVAAVHRDAHPLAGDRLEVGRLGQREAALLRAAHDGLRRAGARTSARRRRRAQEVVLRAARSSTTTSVSAGWPRVIVPVLSRTTVWSLCAVSSASAERMRMPFSAPLPVPTMIESGVASPRAQGQAMISTDTALTRAKVNTGSEPKSYQTTNVAIAMKITAGTK